MLAKSGIQNKQFLQNQQLKNENCRYGNIHKLNRQPQHQLNWQSTVGYINNAIQITAHFFQQSKEVKAPIALAQSNAKELLAKTDEIKKAGLTD